MEDSEIIRLYFERNEAAISETVAKYGDFCHGIALNILSIHADADECVNDAYLRTWNSIPPQRPDKLGAWLGRIVRNVAYDLWKKNHRKKRYAGMEEILYELEECIPSPMTVEHKIEERELTEVMNTWLASLLPDDRILFMRRYWRGEAVNDLAREKRVTPAKMAKQMYRLRQSLKIVLEKEGYLL